MYSRNIKLYPWIMAFQCAWFIEGVWFFYWNKFASYTAIGIIFSITSIISIFLELPTGVFADKYGRKRAGLIGGSLVVIGTVLIASGISFAWLCTGVIMQSMGRAFISGSMEALAYDSLKADQLEGEYDHLAAKRTQVSIIVFALAAVCGGFLYTIHFQLPYILTSLCFLLSFLMMFWLKEPPRKSHHVSSLAMTFAGLKQLTLPAIRPFILSSISIIVIYFIYDWGFGKPSIAVHFGMFSREQGVAYAVMAIVNLFMVGLIPKLRSRFGDLVGLRLLNLLAAVGFMLVALPLGWWGIITMMGIELATNLSEPWLSIIVNQHIASEYRATALSAIQLVGRLPYLALNVLLGTMIDKGHGMMVFIYLGIGIVLIQLFDAMLSKRSQVRV